MTVDRINFRLPWADRLHPVDGPSPSGVTVASVLPRGYSRYVRVFHPFVPWQADFGYASPRSTWQELAESISVPFSPVLTWHQLQPALPLSEDGRSRPWAIWEGELEQDTADALFDDLGRSGRGPFHFGFELSVLVLGDGPLLFRCDSLTEREAVLRAVGSLGAAVNSPEWVWPVDESWIVHTDWDLTSTYVAADPVVASRLLANDRLEAIEVDPETRIDDMAHQQVAK